MARSRIFGFLAIALCLVACLCVSAEVSKDDAAQEIADVQEKASKALNDANENVKKANDILGRVQSHKKGAEKAAADAANAAKGNKKAEAVADKVQEEAKKAIALYAEANAAAQAAVESAKEKVPKAEKLKKDANIAVSPDTDGGSDYKNAKEAATKVKGDVEALQREITESGQLLGPASTAESNMAEPANKAKVSNYQVSIMDSSNKIGIQLEKADSGIKKIEKKRDDADKTLKEIKKLSKKAPKFVSDSVEPKIGLVEGELKKATKGLETAKKAKKEMEGLKKSTDTSLAKVKKESDPAKAAIEANNVDKSDKKVKKLASQIEESLQSAQAAASKTGSINQAFKLTLTKDNSVITASFSLLLALIACAALH